MVEYYHLQKGGTVVNYSSTLKDHSKKEKIQFVLEHIRERKRAKSRKSIKISKKGMKFDKGGNFVEQAIHEKKKRGDLKRKLEKNKSLLNSSFLYIKLGLRWDNLHST